MRWTKDKAQLILSDWKLLSCEAFDKKYNCDGEIEREAIYNIAIEFLDNLNLIECKINKTSMGIDYTVIEKIGKALISHYHHCKMEQLRYEAAHNSLRGR